MPGVIATKIGMTEVFYKGKITPCTILKTNPCFVTQVKTKERDSYDAIQLAAQERPMKTTTKPLQGHFAKAKVTPKRKVVEFRVSELPVIEGKEIKPGTEIKAGDLFKEGQIIEIIGKSKGKGFTGVVKAHNFKGVGDATHGQHNRQRSPGSIGASSYPSRVLPGMRMAKRTGNKRVTLGGIEIIKMMPEKEIILIKGPTPGPRKSTVILK